VKLAGTPIFQEPLKARRLNADKGPPVVRIAVLGLSRASTSAYEVALNALGHEVVELNRPDQFAENAPRVVLLAGNSVDRVGRAVLRRSPDTSIVLLVPDPDANAVRRGLAWGAVAVIDISTPVRRVAATVATICQGDLVILPRGISSGLTHTGASSISPSQVEYLGLLASHLTVREMAMRTHRSTRSLQRDLTRLYRTLGVDGRRGALEVARDLGILKN
jgi:DNA-binding NarL/FixJ family response regulator